MRTLKRPSRAAGIANRLGLEHRDQVDQLLASAARLRKLQAELGGPDSGEKLRTATRKQRDAHERLVEIARSLLGESGRSAVLDRVDETLRAAVGNEETGRLLRAGRLEREQQAAGLTGGAGGGLLTSTPAGAHSTRRSGAKRTRTKTDEAQADPRRELREARAALAKLKRQVDGARASEERAARVVAQAEDRLAAARAKHKQARDELAEHEAEMRRAKRRAERLEGS